jgi:hypothetical protein
MILKALGTWQGGRGRERGRERRGDPNPSGQSRGRPRPCTRKCARPPGRRALRAPRAPPPRRAFPVV